MYSKVKSKVCQCVSQHTWARRPPSPLLISITSHQWCCSVPEHTCVCTQSNTVGGSVRQAGLQTNNEEEEPHAKKKKLLASSAGLLFFFLQILQFSVCLHRCRTHPSIVEPTFLQCLLFFTLKTPTPCSAKDEMEIQQPTSRHGWSTFSSMLR